MNEDKELERHSKYLEEVKNAKTIDEVPDFKISDITKYITNNSVMDKKRISQTLFKPVLDALLDYGMFGSPEVKSVYIQVLKENYPGKSEEEYDEKYKELLSKSLTLHNYYVEMSERAKKIQEIVDIADLEEHNKTLKEIKDAYELKDLPRVGRGVLNKRIYSDTKTDYSERIPVSELQELSNELYNNGLTHDAEDILLEICKSQGLDEEKTEGMFNQIISNLASDKKIGYLIEEVKEKEAKTLKIYKQDHEETMENIKEANRISQLPPNLNFSALTNYLRGNTTIYTNVNLIALGDLKNLTQLLLDGKEFDSEEVKEEIKQIATKAYPEKAEESYKLLYDKLSSLPRTKYIVDEVNYSQKRQQEFIGRNCSNVNVYFIPNPKSPIEGGRFYNCYINRVDNLNLEQIIPLDLDSIVPEDMDVDSIEWYVREYHDPTFKAAGGIILNKDETIGNVNVFKPSDGTIGITPEEKNKYDEIDELGKQVKEIIKNKKEKMEKFKEMQELYFKYQEETDNQLTELEAKIDQLLEKNKNDDKEVR